MHGGHPTSDPTPHAQAPASRPLGRRGTLPSGRAVLGGLLVAIAIVGLFAAQRRSDDETAPARAVVARTVPAGRTLVAADIALLPIELPEELDARTLGDPDAAIGAVAVQTLLPGQLLQDAMIAAPDEAGDAGFELSLAVPRSRAVDGSILPGDLVDVVATLDHRGTACTTVVVDDARVSAVAGAAGDLLNGAGDEITLTLVVTDPASVLAAVNAADRADVTVVRATRAQDVPIEGRWCGDGVIEPGTDGRGEDPDPGPVAGAFDELGEQGEQGEGEG